MLSSEFIKENSLPLNLDRVALPLLEGKTFKEFQEIRSGDKLNFSNVIQLKSNWCWAAVTKAINDFQGGTATQCVIANKTLGKTDCCPPADNSACNIPSSLDQSLRTMGLLKAFITGKITFNEVVTQISTRKRPFALRLEWTGGGGHFISVYGYDYTPAPIVAELILIADPALGTSVQPYATFPSSYNGGANWTHTYTIN